MDEITSTNWNVYRLDDWVNFFAVANIPTVAAGTQQRPKCYQSGRQIVIILYCVNIN